MKEQKILKSKVVSNIKLISLIIFIIGIILGFLIFYVMITEDKEWREYSICMNSTREACVEIKNMSLIEYMEKRNQNSYWIAGFGTVGGFLVLSLVFYFCYSKQEIIITNKRIYGKSIFGKVMNLPLDSISSVSIIKLFKGVSMATSSGKISFHFIANNEGVYNAVSKLLVDRQDKKDNKSRDGHIDYVEELRKLKELMEEGVITKKEFEKKKKELLK